MFLGKVVSGGQTGADLGALDAALDCKIRIGGWVPRGRRNEAGPIPESYANLTEAESDDPARRTELNVRDSDATLILSRGALTGGSAFTKSRAEHFQKPCKHIDLQKSCEGDALSVILQWLSDIKPRILNVAGPRASQDPEIYGAVRRILTEVFKRAALTETRGLEDHGPSADESNEA